jgi:N-acetylglucosaminyldiphosphoundecaprenol N-acetyl-beta-D-mannosaminyltransferase
MRKTVLGSPVDVLSRKDTVGLIADWIKEKPKFHLVVTAYSEFFVRGIEDKEFFKVLKSADLVTPDGVSVLAAVKYLEEVKDKKIIGRFLGGLKTGSEIISGKVGEPVTGVWLFEELTQMAAEKGWRVFLLGGWNDVGGRTARSLLKRFPNLKVAYDPGETRVGTDEATNKRVIEKINKFAPDILFVAYNPIKQEKWLAAHRDVLKAKVAIGVGGTFNEYLGEFRKAPKWMEESGLKWLWRVCVEPRRIKRILRAVFVFPWLVFRNSGR